MNLLFTREFWIAAGGAVARTAVAAAAPFLLQIQQDPPVALTASFWLTLLGVVVPVSVLAALTALKGLPVPTGGPWYEIALQRAVRQFAQVLIGALPATLTLGYLGSADARLLFVYAGLSAIATVILAAFGIATPAFGIATSLIAETDETDLDVGDSDPTQDDTASADTVVTEPEAEPDGIEYEPADA